ncbi:MAG: TonB-dependent receptor [Proteobacteria bacterium]|nr:TonB-dependent receptor [Pseudomonadota bacterium]MDE3207591.1 TonB-dependent receptor [Pseudomonadota bacterium]
MNRHFRFKPVVFAFILTQPIIAFGSTLYTRQDIIVTATRTPELKTHAIQDVTIISSRQLRRSGQETLGEVLQMAPGVELAQTGGAGQAASIFLRGTNSDQTLILLNGVPINTGSLGIASLNAIPISEIDHIEIMQGPASSLYGANAIGGVIQIFTKKGQDNPHPYLSAGIGTLNTSRVNLGYAGQKGKLDFNISAGHDASTSISQTNPSNTFSYNPDNDPYRNTYFSGQVGYHLAPGQEVGLVLLKNRAMVFNDEGEYGTASLQDHTTTTIGNYTVYSKNRINSSWLSQVHFSHAIDDEYTQTANPFSNNGSVNNTQDLVSWQNDFDTSLGTFTLGAENQWQSVGGTSTTFTVNNRTNHSFFGVYHKTFGKQNILFSARHDDNSQFGSKNTGLIGYSYHFTPNFRLSSTIGTAFRAPTFDDLYAIYPFYIANPNLKPEQSLNKEVSLHYSFNNQRISLTYFNNRIRDLITGYTDSNFNYVMTNVGSARIKGIEIGYKGKIQDFRITSSLTFQQPLNEDTQTLLGRRARQFGFIRVSKSYHQWNYGIEDLFSGKRFDSSNSNTSANQLGGYNIANLTVTYQYSRRLSWYTRWNNIFNKPYELALGYNTPGSNVFTGFNYAL